MLKQRREKLLAGVLFGIVGLSLGQDSVNAVVFGPLEDKDAQISALMRKVGDRDQEYRRIEHAQRELQPLRHRSLPPDPSVATALYQNWLIEASQQSGIQAAQIVPGRAIPEEGVGHRILISLQATTGTQQLGAFLDSFYAAPLLHRITNLSVTAAGNSRDGAQPRVTIAMEALALADAPPRTELLLDDVTPSDDGSNEGATSARQFFAASDPFQRGYHGPPRPMVPSQRTAPTAPRMDPLTQIRLVASFTSGQQPEVWFYDNSSRQQTVVAEGADFRFAALQGRVVRVLRDSVLLEIDGTRRVLALGDDLKQLKPVGS